MHDDARTFDNLVDGVDATHDDAHMWLAPYTPGREHIVWLWLDQPLAISMIKFWNYAKTPTRGAAEFEVHLDGASIYRGIMRQAPVRDVATSDFVHTILFTNDAAVLEAEKWNVKRVAGDQGVVLYNDGRNLTSSGVVNSQPGAVLSDRDLATRPKTTMAGRE